MRMSRGIEWGRQWMLLAVAALITLTAIGCGGGSDVDLNQATPKAEVKWGKPAGGDPKGVVILLHGGGWQPNRAAFEGEMPLAANLQQRGYATVVVGYGEGETGFRQVEQVFSKARKRYPDLPICAHGFSAGGTLALLLAAREPDLACVVGLVTPTDLTTVEDQGGDEVHDLAVKAFGEDQLGRWSPVRSADGIDAKVLLIPAQDDPIVPIAQAREFVRAHPETELDVIPAGPTPVDFLHGAGATPAGVQEATQHQFTFIDQATSGAG
jgi:acetyl esterase/lipase